MAKTTTTMTFDPPKMKKPKTVYRYEAEAKALVGKVFADGNRIGKVIKAEKHRQDHTWRCWFRYVCAQEENIPYFENGKWKCRDGLFLKDYFGMEASSLLLPYELMNDYQEATQGELDLARAISEGAAIELRRILEHHKK